MKPRKGIILAGGSGTRLYPVTMAVSKQLMPVYDKPMIYYPLCVLMLAGIREVALISTPRDKLQFQQLLGDGAQWGMEITYIEQPSPDGLAQAYMLAENFLDGAPSAMILGDNIFFGHDLQKLVVDATETSDSTVFGYQVSDPERYGVVDFDDKGRAISIVEKPEVPASNYAVTGLYFLDETAPEKARNLKPSPRGELEIADLLEIYLQEDKLTVALMGRGFGWLDTGTHDSLLDAANFVRTIEKRQGLKIGSPEEVAYFKKWISREELHEVAKPFLKTEYGQYLMRISQ